jgi:sulfoxide reductase heme-binding subunit YedZ
MTLIQRLNIGLRRIPPWTLYFVGVIPLIWLFWLAATGGLGFEPIKELEHRLGELALQMLIVVLAIRPLYDRIGVNLMAFRRALGLVTFLYVFAHMLVWLVLDVGILSEIWADILKRPYITVGMASLVLMTPLAMSSNNLSLRKMGPKRWRLLHRLTYPAAFLGALHYVMLARGFQWEPLMYLGVVVLLLGLRLRLPRRSVVA